MNRTVKYQGAFFRIVGFAGKRFLFSPHPPPSTFFFFAPAPNFRAVTQLETLATQAKREHKVQLLVNEMAVGLPCCHGNTTCTLDGFVSCFEETVKSCDFDAMCSLPLTEKPKALAPIFYNRLDLMLLALVTPLVVENMIP